MNNTVNNDAAAEEEEEEEQTSEPESRSSLCSDLSLAHFLADFESKGPFRMGPTIRMWDARTGKAIMEPIQGHTDKVLSVAFSPDGAHIASGSRDKTIRAWDATMGKAVMEPIKCHTARGESVVFSPNGACIASGSDSVGVGVC
ncbi:WD40-repeat-containing domain protein [Mycena olivaceomarginata]|nr:WD40-repeat-containing domain protein [Mycena olivaceomarginata]